MCVVKLVVNNDLSPEKSPESREGGGGPPSLPPSLPPSGGGGGGGTSTDRNAGSSNCDVINIFLSPDHLLKAAKPA